MATKKELLDKRAALWNSMKEFIDAHHTESGVMSAEDDANYKKMEKDFDGLTNEIDRMDRMASMEDVMNRATSSPILTSPREEKGRAANGYTKAFWNVMRHKYPSQEVVNALQVGTDSEGGYLVPDEFDRTLVQSLHEENIFRTLATTIQTESGDHKIPVVATEGTASWIDEEGAFTESDTAFSQVSLGAFKIGTLMKVSDELLNDSVFNLEAYIAQEYGRRIGNGEETAFVSGNGSGKPTGILASTGGAQVGVTAASATKIAADEIIDLVYSLKAPYRKKSAFLINDAIVKVIRKLKDGNGNYMWQPALTLGQPDTLLGYPVYTSSAMPSEVATTNKTIAFGDFSYYWIADRQGRVFKRLNELYAANGQVGFLAWERVDGKLILPEAIKVLQQA